MSPNVVAQYERNREAYEEIDSRLSDVKRDFISASRDDQKEKLLRSVEFALISVQTPLGIAERAYAQVAAADTEEEIKDALGPVNYQNNKFRYIMHNREAIETESAEEIITLLEDGQIKRAHEQTADTFLGVGIVKAGFALAMLGFKECLCTDTNVIQSVDFDVQESYNDVDEYWNICQKILDYYDELSENLPNFLVQWVIFDAMRGEGVAYHAEFFHSIMDDINLPKQADLTNFA